MIPRIFIFVFRLFVFVPYAAAYFAVLQHLPLPTAVRKLLLWGLMGIPGIWWVDVQLDGVKRGHLSQQPPGRVPHPGSVIAANFTSPIDAIYLAAIFDPVFTVSYPGRTRKLRRVSLLGAVAQALSPTQLARGPPSSSAGSLTDLRALMAANPDRVVVVFPECATTNGQGVLPFSPSLLSAPPGAPIFPLSIRYAPPDVTTPVPGLWAAFLWKLLSRPTHLIRVRIAESIANDIGDDDDVDDVHDDFDGSEDDGSDVTHQERLLLDRVAEALARLGRNKRVGLTLRDKEAFMRAWNKAR